MQVTEHEKTAQDGLPEERNRTGSSTGPGTAARCRVLIVEDEFWLAWMMADALRERGCEVEVAANVKDALNHLASRKPCDLLFTDIDLRDRIDGAALSRVARELRPNLAVVYASGRTAH